MVGWAGAAGPGHGEASADPDEHRLGSRAQDIGVALCGCQEPLCINSACEKPHVYVLCTN